LAEHPTLAQTPSVIPNALEQQSTPFVHPREGAVVVAIVCETGAPSPSVAVMVIENDSEVQ